MKTLALTTFTLLLLISKSVFATGLDDLQRFYSGIESFSAKFEQTVMDEKMNLLDASSGEFSIQRPGKFFWHYTSPSEQIIIGDGKQVWIYDVELEQITHRQSEAAISQMPAMLLSGKGDLSKSFVLEGAGKRSGLNWVRMIPRAQNAGFTEINIGFSGGSLKRLELKDNFGQTTQMYFNDTKENIKIPDSTFIFTPPPGVDIIEEAG